MNRPLAAGSLILTTALLSLPALPCHAVVTVGADACVWDSSVPQAPPVLGIGGSGQVNGDFTLDTVDLGGSAFQIGLRAQERYGGPVLPRTENVYFATSGTSGTTTLGATWNYDLHLDFGTDDTDTGVIGQSLESQLAQVLTALNIRDYTVEFLLDTDPTVGTTFTTTDLNAFLTDFTVGPDVLLFQTSQNLLFATFGGALDFDQDIDGVYTFVLRVSEAGSGTVLAESSIHVVVGDPDLGCEEGDPLGICPLFEDGFESGNTTLWSSSEGEL